MIILLYSYKQLCLNINTMIKLLYLNNTVWEYDFIVNDLLVIKNLEKEIEIFHVETFNSLLKRKDLVENNILVLNRNIQFDNIITVVKYIKPLIIFYLSDEHGNEKHITILENYTNILFRQYNHSHYVYSKNNHQLPLGYCKNFINNKTSLNVQRKKICERTINCSFIGTIKSDRLHMITLFENNMKNTKFIHVNNNWDINNLPCSPEKTFGIYSDSIFVINGRGNSNLDCFRIYEAIVAGAIPVLVGSTQEISITFNYNNDIPPFIYDETWEKVLIKCNHLLNNVEELQQIQNNLISWWNNKILTIQMLVKKYTMSPV